MLCPWHPHILVPLCKELACSCVELLVEHIACCPCLLPVSYLGMLAMYPSALLRGRVVFLWLQVLPFSCTVHAGSNNWFCYQPRSGPLHPRSGTASVHPRSGKVRLLVRSNFVGAALQRNTSRPLTTAGVVCHTVTQQLALIAVGPACCGVVCCVGLVHRLAVKPMPSTGVDAVVDVWGVCSGAQSHNVRSTIRFGGSV